MNFSIHFTGEPKAPSAIGHIKAGDLDEDFVSSLYEWKKETYEQQWLDSLNEFANGADRAVLITWYVNPKESDNLQWRALYRGEAGIVHVQNHLRWYKDFNREFIPVQASKFLCDRKTVTEEGPATSEWHIPIGDLEIFLDRLR
jgi:hypothetical protein